MNKQRLLVIIDYQNDFVTGSLGFLKAKELEIPICERITHFKGNNDTVLYTLDTHNNDYLNTNEGNHLPIAHCIDGEHGHKLYGEVGKLCDENDIIIKKSSFGGSEFYDYLLKNPYPHIEICGIVSNICVISNAILAKTALPEADIYINTNCIASNDDNLNDSAISVLKSLQFIMI